MASQEAPRIINAPRFVPKESQEEHVSRLRSILVRDGNFVTLTDWDAAVYLHGVRRMGIAGVEKIQRSMRLITLYDPHNLADRQVIDFVNSESALYADGQRRMKKIVHSFGSNRGSRNNGNNGNNGGRK